MARAHGAASQSARTGLFFAAYATLAVLLVCAAYEIAFAARVLSPGPLPGQAPAGHGTILLSAFSGMLIGVGVCFAALGAGRLRTALPALLAMGPAAATFVTARFYTYDPYYLPTLRRISDNGVIPEGWVFGLLAASALGVVMTKLWPAPGLLFSSLLLLVCAGTALFESAGH